MLANPPARSFVPRDLDPADFSQLEPLYRALLDRPLDSPAAVARWLADLSELTAVVDEFGSRRYIQKSCHTDDPAIEKAYLHFVEKIEPNVKPLFFALQKKLLQSPHRASLGPEYAVMLQRWQADVDLFRPENVPLETEATRLVTTYDKACGEMMVTLRGREYTLQQAGKFLEEPDRALRQEAWERVAQRRLQDRAKIETLYDRLLELRQTIARNAGLPDYRAYAWRQYKRFDYTPDDCLRFADAIEAVCMPVVRQLDARRAADLKLPALRPWDLAVDPQNRPPLRPFTDEQVEAFIDKTQSIFRRLSPQLADDFSLLRTAGNLDLASRKGKQPGGYQASLEESRLPFIFMNAAGLQRDVETLLHEGGHAFHFLAACQTAPVVFLRGAPMEFCEVASMSMELLGSDHFDAFYSSPTDIARARRALLEGIVRFFPWMTTIDSFQHWIYTHPNHSPQDRTRAWLDLMNRFGGAVDWTGCEDARASRWQAQLHLFHAPFYYIEYGIAQLGALQLWMKSRQDPHRALASYRAALRLGGTRSLPDLFAAAGLHFDFTEKTLRPLISALTDELASLPA